MCVQCTYMPGPNAQQKEGRKVLARQKMPCVSPKTQHSSSSGFDSRKWFQPKIVRWFYLTIDNLQLFTWNFRMAYMQVVQLLVIKFLRVWFMRLLFFEIYFRSIRANSRSNKKPDWPHFFYIFVVVVVLFWTTLCVNVSTSWFQQINVVKTYP